MENKSSDLRKDVEKGKDKASEAKDAFADAANRGKEKIQEVFQDVVVEYVRNNPVKSVGISILAGVIIAKLMHARSK